MKRKRESRGCGPLQAPQRSNTMVMQTQYGDWFAKTAGVILLVTGIAKVLSGLGKASVLAAPDPIFVLPFGKLLLAVGAVEVVISVMCFHAESTSVSSSGCSLG